ncbi:MAG: cytochrome c3 family protein [Leptospiraceae bacterium]|nr:cytochrome c3 family protein [Leptospiraceae bacterium]
MDALKKVLQKHAIKLILPLLGLVAVYWIYVVPPKYQGYAPDQPVPFSHKIHAGELGMDCQFCHTAVEKGPHATLPDSATCMRCHAPDTGVIASDSPNIQFMRQMYSQGRPIHWTKVYDLPDHVRFSHKPHVAKGIDCTECHGAMEKMEKVSVQVAFNMGWCVNCHRDPKWENQKLKPGNNTSVHLTECGTCHY